MNIFNCHGIFVNIIILLLALRFLCISQNYLISEALTITIDTLRQPY